MNANAKKAKTLAAKPVRESKELVSALRKELRRLVEDDALGHNLERISIISKRAADLVMALRSPEETWKKHKGHHLIPSFGVSPNVAEEFSSFGPSSLYGSSSSMMQNPPTSMGVETYGSSVIKQILPALKEYQQAMKETPQALVDAIATARRMGMTDVAAELEKKLCGKSLDGERPISSDLVTIGDYLPPKPKAAIGHEWSTPAETNGKSKSKETVP
jgi:hypothetical protein